MLVIIVIGMVRVIMGCGNGVCVGGILLAGWLVVMVQDCEGDASCGEGVN